ncbi:MAG: DUF503 domain-containing protein [Candidatus Omnitrophica bacterium]|nr:DUF503 domain-containing protein [Candidatus Omnitrophota bacterium]
MKHIKSPALSAETGQKDPEVPEKGFVGYLRLKVFMPENQSLKDRRQTLEGLKKKVRNKFNISVAQDGADTHKSSELFFVCANYRKAQALEVLQNLENFIINSGQVHIIGLEKGVI